MANTLIQCPNCGSFATKPTHGDDAVSREKDAFANIISDFSFGRNRFSFDNPKWIQEFNASRIRAVCESCKFIFNVDIMIPKPASTNTTTSNQQHNQQGDIEERLAGLEQLKAKGLITEEEYQLKRKEILRKL